MFSWRTQLGDFASTVSADGTRDNVAAEAASMCGVDSAKRVTLACTDKDRSVGCTHHRAARTIWVYLTVLEWSITVFSYATA